MERIDRIILAAIKEDMPKGDITTDNIFSRKDQIEGKFIAKEKGVISGIEIAERVFSFFPNVSIVWNKKDGDIVNPTDIIGKISGSARSILKGERLALNIMQRMSGIATKTNNLVNLVSHTHCQILDTRKTTPNFRILEKMAVEHGGGRNHRFSLSDMVMIKDNHIKAAGGISEAVAKVKKKVKNSRIEVEVENLAMLQEALKEDIDIIMLDNMSIDEMKKAVELTKDKLLEASGNINEETIKEIAETGVDFVSVGALTHSYKSLDISLKF